MKPKFWTVKDGEVVPVGHFDRGMNHVEVQASTKGEATKVMLTRFEKMSEHVGPRLWVKDGAYALAWHNGKDWSFEGGLADRKFSSGTVCALVVGGTAKVEDVPEKASLDYYAAISAAENPPYLPEGNEN
jgi:hypothetical protein